LVKKYLRELNVQFIEEFQPCLDINRFFSIDIAFPDKKIGIEINGFQHYEDDNFSLKPYYQKRHDILENLGWKIYEIHYSLCYNHDEISKILPQILASEKKIEFDYTIFRHKEKKIKVSELDPNWRYRPRPLSRKERPSKQQLIDYINNKTSFNHIAKIWNVSSRTVRSWIKNDNISYKRYSRRNNQ
jgi:very-short-patch-repair endonuclease